ncbi:MAG: PilZ domain-containing protein [Halofilum sp. (in: g-proteobacteria)]|nr:PilZ domain-containing protein [Halofilum sp. (in: g-proteobacteria)]
MVESSGKRTTAGGRERTYIRHPARVPIRVTSVSAAGASEVADVSYGGLSFTCPERQQAGAEIELRIPDVDPGFRGRARVVWCRSTRDGYRVGVRFLDPHDAFRSRMVEQLCAIEGYRREVLEREGRRLTGDQAAAEWIRRYADGFPDP